MLPRFHLHFSSTHLVPAPHLSFSTLLLPHHMLVLPICFLLAVHTRACCPQGLAESPSAFYRFFLLYQAKGNKTQQHQMAFRRLKTLDTGRGRRENTNKSFHTLTEACYQKGWFGKGSWIQYMKIMFLWLAWSRF